MNKAQKIRFYEIYKVKVFFISWYESYHPIFEEPWKQFQRVKILLQYLSQNNLTFGFRVRYKV